MKDLHVYVNQRVATYRARDGFIICDNSDYRVKFIFDPEWSGAATKYACFVWAGGHSTVEITGNTALVPPISTPGLVKVGVCTDPPEVPTEGNFWTTTAAIIPCKKSVLST